MTTIDELSKRDKLIAAQQLEISEMKERLANIKEDANAICLSIICIGGPLNDNKKRYTREQQSDWHRVLGFAESILSEYPNESDD